MTIEQEVQEDLNKSEMHLLVDVYTEILKNPDRSIEENAIHAAKRFTALLGKFSIGFAKSSEASALLQKEVNDMTKALLRLTEYLVILTIIATVASLLSIYTSLKDIMHF